MAISKKRSGPGTTADIWGYPALEPAPKGDLTSAVRHFEVMSLIANGWRLTGTVDSQGGHLRIASFSLESETSKLPAGGIDSALLRSIPIGRFRDQMVAQVARLIAEAAQPVMLSNNQGEHGVSPNLVVRRHEILQEIAKQVEPLRQANAKRGRKGLPDNHYRQIALEYLAIQDERERQGLPLRGIIKQLADNQNPKSVPDTVRTWLAVATRKEFLSKGRQGQAGRSPGRLLYRQEPPSEQ